MVNELLLSEPRGTFVHLFSASRKRGNCSIYTRLLYKSVKCHRSKKDTHFPQGCANPQHVDRNGQEDNEWKKRENRCYLKRLKMVWFFLNTQGCWKLNNTFQ